MNIKATPQIPKGWQKKQIKDLLDYERPDKYIVESDRYLESGTPVLTANKSFVLGYTDEKVGVYRNTPVIIFDDFTTDSKFVDFPFKIKSSAIKILKSKAGIDLRFVFEKMKSINFPTGSHKRYYISQYQNMDVAVPPFLEQKKIAEILSAVDEEIQKTDEIIFTTEKLKRGLMGNLLSAKKSWRDVTLNKLGEIVTGNTPKTAKKNTMGIILFGCLHVILQGRNIFQNPPRCFLLRGMNRQENFRRVLCSLFASDQLSARLGWQQKNYQRINK